MSLAPSIAVTRAHFNPLPLYICLFCVLWSFAFVAGKIGVTYCPPLILLTARFSLAGILILGISALSVWGGNAQWGEDLKRRIAKVAGFDIPVAIATDAVFAALKLHGVKRRIAIMEPYFPSIEPKMVGVFGAAGYEIVRYNHMRGKSPTTYSVVTAQDMIRGIRAIDGPDVEAIVQFGANLPMARIADEAERWLDKPVISINVATYWHALRTNGITDKLYGFTSLPPVQVVE